MVPFDVVLNFVHNFTQSMDIKKGNYSVHTGAWKIRGAIPFCIFQLASFVQ
jgi:hypothetical protein